MCMIKYFTCHENPTWSETLKTGSWQHGSFHDMSCLYFHRTKILFDYMQFSTYGTSVSTTDIHMPW